MIHFSLNNLYKKNANFLIIQFEQKFVKFVAYNSFLWQPVFFI